MSKVFEIVYRYVVPSIRREIALELLRRGFTEVEISKSLGISKSLVTRYVKGERGSLIRLGDNPIVRQTVDKIALSIETGKPSIIDIEEEIVKVALNLLSTKSLCNVHRKLDKRFNPKTCRICTKLFTTPCML